MQDKYNEFVQDVKNTFITELENGKTVGSISELYDSKKPFESKGALHKLGVWQKFLELY